MTTLSVQRSFGHRPAFLTSLHDFSSTPLKKLRIRLYNNNSSSYPLLVQLTIVYMGQIHIEPINWTGGVSTLYIGPMCIPCCETLSRIVHSCPVSSGMARGLVRHSIASAHPPTTLGGAAPPSVRQAHAHLVQVTQGGVRLPFGVAHFRVLHGLTLALRN